MGVVLVKTRVRFMWRLAQRRPLTVFLVGGAIAGVMIWWSIADIRKDTNRVIRDVQIIQRTVDSKCDRATQPGASIQVRRECNRILREARKRESVNTACITVRKGGYPCPVGDARKRVEDRREGRQDPLSAVQMSGPATDGTSRNKRPPASPAPDNPSPSPSDPAPKPPVAPPVAPPVPSPPSNSSSVNVPGVADIEASQHGVCAGVAGIKVGVGEC